MKKIIFNTTLAILFVSTLPIFAQNLLNKSVESGSKAPVLSVTLNGNAGKSLSTGVSNGISFNPNIGLELSFGHFGLGLDAGTFSTAPDFDFSNYTSSLKGLDFLTVSGVNSQWRSSSVVFGPTYTISLGGSKANQGISLHVFKPSAALTLSLKGGLTFNDTPNFSVLNNSTQKNIAAYSPSTEYEKNALTIKPSASFSYSFSENIALNANLQYSMQTGQTPFSTGYKDLSAANIRTPITADQFTKNISSAPSVITSTVGPDKYLSFGVGITYSFGRKGWDGSIKGNRKGITQLGIKINEVENNMTDAEVKAIAETLVSLRKGWDGSVKGGNVAEKKGINENGLKKNEAKSENTNLDLTSTAQTLVNLARKGWDGSIKGGKVDNETNEVDLMTVTKTLENIRKGWDGSIKGNKTEYVANDADVKAIAETLVNLRKGWDGTVKGGSIQERGIDKKDVRKNAEKGIQENGLTTNQNIIASIEEKGVIWGLGGNLENNKVNNINNNMPNRISMNVTVGKQTQGATFGEKVNAGRINVTLVEGGCIILFPDNGFRVNIKDKTITELSANESAGFGEKVNAGLHAAGGALASGASLLGGALPGGAIISAAVSSVGNLAGGNGGGASAASYAKTADKKKKKVWDSRKDDNCDGLKTLPDGDYEIAVEIEQKIASKPIKTLTIIQFSSISNVLKTKHDTAKNSVSNIR